MNLGPQPASRPSPRRRPLRVWTTWLAVLAAVVFRADLAPPLKAGPLTQCFPTCVENDGRFLIVPGGIGADTFTRSDVQIGFRLPFNKPTFPFGIFDMETGVTWDQAKGPGVQQLR